MNKELKRLAQNARNRLIHKGENPSSSKAVVSSPNIKFKVISPELDENFNVKAQQVLESGSLSPMSDLMDLNYYSSLDDLSKEKYLLDTVEKFNRYKEKFERKIEQKLVY